MNEDEKLAKFVVEGILDDARMEKREEEHGDGSLRYDFWLHRPDRDRAALEVTSVRDEDRMRTSYKLAEHGHVLEAKHCNRSWAVWLAPQTRYDEVEANLDRRLAELENRGVDRISPVHTVSTPAAVRALRADLSIESAMSFSPEDTPTRIYLHVSGTGGYVHAGKVSEAVETEAAENAKKLGETGAPERHLFLHITHSDVAASALARSDPEEDAPNLPSEVTHAWAAAKRLGTEDEFTVWRARNGEPWRSAGAITVPGGGPAPLP